MSAQQPWPPRPPQPQWPQPPQAWSAPAPGWSAPQQGWQASPAWQPAPQGSVPQRTGNSGALRAVLIGVIAVVALGFFAFAATTFFLTRAQTPSGPTPGPPSTTVASPTPVEPTPTPSPVEPSPEPTTGPDDYDPPPIPRPGSVEEATRWLRENPLYQQRTKATDCAIARIGDPTPPKELAVFDEHLNATMGCLTQVWMAPATDAGFILLQPPVLAYDQPITTACGTSPAMDYAAAFYCSGDQRIYYGMPRSNPLFYKSSLEVDGVLAHEFGHAIQGRIGILSAESMLIRRVETDDEVLEYSRRTEMQADCLAGMALNSVSEASGITKKEREILRENRYLRGDREGYPRDHGAPESRLYWVTVGLDNTDIGTCDTYSADSELVK